MTTALQTQTAPDFALKDYQGQLVRLADFQGKKRIILVFNRGFN